MSTFVFLRSMRSSVVKALALAFVFSLTFAGKIYAATDWSAIQSALNATGNVMPGNVLRFELVRQDLTSLAVNGQPVPGFEIAAVANGFIAFEHMYSGQYFVDGSLPAQETELASLEAALRADKAIRITAVVNHVIEETPALIWVHFEATGDGASLATALASALQTINNPQENVLVVPGTNTVFNPASILPPQYLKLYDEGYVEQLNGIFVFYLPRPDEHQIWLDGARAETGLGVGQTFYIQIDFNGGTNATLNVDFALRAGEVQAVEDALRAGGFTVTSQSSHYFGDQPHLYFVHVAGSGDGFTLGQALYNAVEIIQADSHGGHDHDWDDWGDHR
ncbi:MAG TPA: DUF1259 domain-containing protein [Terracidiphilus sp.]|nr:DUF1259 domain-containing protein [Terracidiphilus sp.]